MNKPSYFSEDDDADAYIVEVIGDGMYRIWYVTVNDTWYIQTFIITSNDTASQFASRWN